MSALKQAQAAAHDASEEGTGPMANISLQGQMKAWTPLTLNAGFPVHLRIYDGLSVFLLSL